jgi:NADP-dependent 3-hydroxy acid dehydrogenase YdfG
MSQDDQLTLRGRTALVTGASRGIGLDIARLLAGAGVRCALVARGAPALAAAAAEVGGQAISADASDEDSVEALRGAVERSFGGAPDFVVNAAGAFHLAPIARTSVEVFDRQIALNLRAPFLITRAFLPAMLERGSGHLLTLGSVAGRTAFPGNGAYSAAKFGLRGLHEVLAEELRGTGVRATLIEPAATDTTLWDTIDAGEYPHLPPRATMLRATDVARAAVFALTQPAGVEISVVSLRSTQ